MRFLGFACQEKNSMTDVQDASNQIQPPGSTHSDTVRTNKRLYWTHGWGDDYFAIDAQGRVTVQPGRGAQSINLYDQVKLLEARGISLPILFCFDGIIRDRVKRMYAAFDKAFSTYHYHNSYQLAYPVKVNQQKHIVDTVRTATNDRTVSLEVGSKPELVAVLGIHDADGALLLCNGYKDAEYIELALLSRKIGRRPIIIIEQFYELKLVLELAEKLDVTAEIGLRMNPHFKGSGKWAGSAGEAAKFGLSSHEIVVAIETLARAGKSDWLKLLHMHIGSQLTSIIHFKKALSEAARTFVEIAKICPSICYFDVGGGLGVDYEGSKTTADCSMDYSIEQYAAEVVYTIGSVCAEAGIPDPVIISESGRAIVAHHAILVTEVIDVAPISDAIPKLDAPPTDNPLLLDMYDTYHALTVANCIEALHDCSALRSDAIERFMHGTLTLQERAYAERTLCHATTKALMLSKQLDFVPQEIAELYDKQRDMYFCNLSVFRSIPDAWAIQQLFPIMPIHRLDETPTRKAILADVTCDSDGMINKFVGQQKIAPWLPLHEYSGSPYYLGIFLVGAYQEILGGFHNLFGSTNTVHIDSNERGRLTIKHQIEGNVIKDVLGFVRYDADHLQWRLRQSIAKALKNKQLTQSEATRLKHRFKQALESYTYLVA